MADLVASVTTYFHASIPPSWFPAPVEIRIDREEILVTGNLPPEADVPAFRESTREQRVVIAAEAESRWGRAVSWAVTHGDHDHRFTTVSVPVMTRLRFDERSVLDTLIAGGIARSRSDALGWCVRLVGENERAWLAELLDATAAIREVRERGPLPPRHD